MATKKKLGRPTLPKGEARTEILQVRVTKAEKRALERQAGTQEMSQWLRSQLIREE